ISLPELRIGSATLPTGPSPGQRRRGKNISPIFERLAAAAVCHLDGLRSGLIDRRSAYVLIVLLRRAFTPPLTDSDRSARRRMIRWLLIERGKTSESPRQHGCFVALAPVDRSAP